MTAISTSWSIGLPQPGQKRRLKSPSYNPIWLLSQAREVTTQKHVQSLPVDCVDTADIKETLQGSSDAYARLVNRYQKEITAQLWRYAPRPEMIEELVHDVFVEAYLSLRSFRGQAPFLHWLRKIAVRVGYRYWKSEAKRRTHMRLPTDVSANAPATAMDHGAVDGTARLNAVLERLSPRDRAVITLIHLEERSVAEAADLLGWSQAMVKVQAFRARRKLKKLLQEAH